MPILSISRDWGVSPSMVRITSSDNLATVATANYMASQAPVIASLNNGAWQWVVGDLVAMTASDGDNIFKFNGSNFNTLIANVTPGAAVVLPTVANDVAMFNNTSGTLIDSGVAVSSLVSGSQIVSMQQFLGIASIFLFDPSLIIVDNGNGDYAVTNNTADFAAPIPFDVGAQIQLAANHGFRLDSYDVIYNIALHDMSITTSFYKETFVNLTDPVTTNIPLVSSTLPGTPTPSGLGSSYVINVAVATPAFDNTSCSKYILEIDVDTQSNGGDLTVWGINLHFSKTVA
jgi:hypothetical protein